jgi:hypothetical protein
MVKKMRKSRGKRPRKISKKVRKPRQVRIEKSSDKPSPKTDVKLKVSPIISPTPPSYDVRKDSSVFSIEPDNISGETTIGDLIVVFPKTRHVLMKHGLRFDVEEAGYIYMTLNVFSALHGLGLSNLLQELVIISKEPPTPLLSQPSPQIPAQPPST